MKDNDDMLQFVLSHYRHGILDTEKALWRFRERTGLDRMARRYKRIRIAGIAAACSALIVTGVLLNNVRLNRWEETTAGTVVLPDRTSVRLKEGSVLAFQPRRFDRQRIVRLNGTGYFEVTYSPSVPFEVHSGDASIRVIGTKFQFDTENSEVHVGEGRVLFSAEGAEHGLEMPAGTSAVLAPGGRTARIHSPSITQSFRLGYRAGYVRCHPSFCSAG